MGHDQIIKKIVELGIPEKEARIYIALLKKREMTALEIQEIAHVPRTKVYEFTQRMIVKNMCIEKRVRTKKKYQAVEPRKFFQTMIRTQEQAIDEKRCIAQELEKTITRIYEQGHHSTAPAETIEIITNLTSIQERYVSFVRNLKKELVGLVKQPYVHQYDDDKIHEQDEELYKKMKKGIQAHMIYEFHNDDKKIPNYEYIKKCVDAGEQARILEKLPMKAYIFDKRFILMILVNAKTELSPFTMFVVDNPPMASLGIALFDALWKDAKDYRILASSHVHDTMSR